MIFEYNELVTLNYIKLDFGRARRGGSGALYLQSAIAGLNSCHRLFLVGSARHKWQ